MVLGKEGLLEGQVIFDDAVVDHHKRSRPVAVG